MISRIPQSWPMLALGLLVAGLLAQTAAAEKSARDLLPSSTVGYLEIPHPELVLNTLLDHPLAKEIERQPDVQKALQSSEYERAMNVVRLFEDKLGMNWRPAVNQLTGGGLHLGFDLPTQGVVVLAQSSDSKLVEKARDTVLELARSEAARKGEPDPVQQDDHRGITIYQLNNGFVASFGKFLLVSNKQLLVRMVLENQFDEGVSLAEEEQFQTALKQRPQDPTAWLYADLRILRLTGVLRKALDKKSNNPGVELVAGGVLGALPDAPYVTANLHLTPSQLKLSASLPCDTQAVAKRRDFYFGPDGNGTAPALLAPKQTMLSLSTYRDFASIWRNAPDLFDEKINAQLAEAEGGLKTLFAGRDFRDEILGNLEPGMQLVAVRQDFDGITPTIKLPAGAVVMRMKNHEETMRIFKITYQSVVGFLNIAGGQNGLEPLDLNSERKGEALIVSAEYLPPKAELKNEAPLHFNASPTIAFVKEWVILASTKPLATELVELVQQKQSANAGTNSQFVVDGQVVRESLADNRGPLVAQNMLEKGHEREAAEKEVDTLLHILRGVKQSSARLEAEDNTLRLTLEFNLATQP